MVRLSGSSVALFLEITETPLSNMKGFVNGVLQVGPLVFPLQMLGLVAHHKRPMARNLEFDAHNGRDRTRSATAR